MVSVNVDSRIISINLLWKDCLNTSLLLKKVLKLVLISQVVVDKGSWHPWALQRLSWNTSIKHLEYVIE